MIEYINRFDHPLELGLIALISIAWQKDRSPSHMHIYRPVSLHFRFTCIQPPLPFHFPQRTSSHRERAHADRSQAVGQPSERILNHVPGLQFRAAREEHRVEESNGYILLCDRRVYPPFDPILPWFDTSNRQWVGNPFERDRIGREQVVASCT